MFEHNYNYTIKTLFRDKMLIFWTFAFPLILATFFHMAFSNIEKSEQLDIIDIAVVENENYKNSLLLNKVIPTLSDKKEKNRLFRTKYVTEQKAKKLLKEEKIEGYLIVEEKPKVVVMTNGINQTVLKQVVEETIAKEETLKKITEVNLKEHGINESMKNTEYWDSWIGAIHSNVLTSWEQGTTILDPSNHNLSYTMIEFYTLIAMTCLYGGILGMVAMNRSLANMSSKGKRIAVSPVSKTKIILSSALASYITQLVGVFLLFVYTIFILKVDYGENLKHIVMLTMTGCLAGLSLGLAVTTLLKTKENTKMGIILSITMIGCFFSGMMGITMKYVIDKNIPIINKLNPANMITDGFYALYYYNKTLDRFQSNLVSLLIFSTIMIVISIFSLRRQKYDSI